MNDKRTDSYHFLITPLVSLVILTLGSALLTTFLSLRLHALGVNTLFVGALSTAYYAGMVLGAFKLERVILRVGHIRSYSAFASILSAAALLHGFYVNTFFWLFLRFIEGVATAGLYVVIESWILSGSDNQNRGTALAYYMVALYIAQALGQCLLNIGHQESLILYAVSAIFASLSVIPLCLAKVDAPSFSEPEVLSIKQMFRISPSGVTTCVISGLVLASIYGLYPVYLQAHHFPLHEISIIMAVTIFGGMVFQYPLGKLSDLISRRYVISGLALATAMVSAALLFFGESSAARTNILSFLLGGAAFCLYPIGISHACDRVTNHQMVSATQTLLLSYGIGATLGPLLAPLCNTISRGNGLLTFFILASTSLTIYMLWRKIQKPAVPEEEKHDFTLSLEMTPVAIEMDPRVEK